MISIRLHGVMDLSSRLCAGVATLWQKPPARPVVSMSVLVLLIRCSTVSTVLHCAWWHLLVEPEPLSVSLMHLVPAARKVIRPGVCC